MKRRVGYLPDAVGFYDGMTGRQNLRYTARLNGLRGDEAETRRWPRCSSRSASPTARTTASETYSRGMRQRLGIADALVKSPDILILDEPTTAIDPLGVVEILDLLRGLVHDRGLAVLLSSHLLTQVQSVCDRIGIFASGRMVGEGTVTRLASLFGDGAATLEVGLELSGPDGHERARSVLAGLPSVVAVEAPAPRSDAWRLTVRPAADEGNVRQACSSRPWSTGCASRRCARSCPRSTTSTARRSSGAARRIAPPRHPAGIRTWEDRRMTAAAAPIEAPADAPATTKTLRVPSSGWRVVANKEFGDHVTSVRFVVLLFVLGLAAAIPLYFAADRIRSLASAAVDAQQQGALALFLALFTARSRRHRRPADRRSSSRSSAPAARPGVRVRRGQRRAIRGDAATPARPADLPRRRRSTASSPPAWP